MNLDGIWEFAFTHGHEETPVYNSFAPVPGCFDAVGLRYGSMAAAGTENESVVRENFD